MNEPVTLAAATAAAAAAASRRSCATPLLMASLPVPPSINREPYTRIVTREGKTVRGEKEWWTAYRDEVHTIIKAYYTPAPWRVWQDGVAIRAVRERLRSRRSRERTALAMTIWWHFTTLSSDIDNRVKAIQDTLCKYPLLVDDRYIREMYLRKCQSTRANPHIEVLVEDVSTCFDFATQPLWNLFEMAQDERARASDMTVPDLLAVGE